MERSRDPKDETPRQRIKRRLHGLKQEFEAELRAEMSDDFRLDYTELPPPTERFIPYATMFKLLAVDSRVVECVACGSLFPASDIIEGELEEDQCPHCKVWAMQWWMDRDHRPAPPE